MSEKAAKSDHNASGGAATVTGKLLAIPLHLLPSVNVEEIGPLARSIARRGLLEPIRVLRRGTSFIVVDGLRRVAAYRWLIQTAPTVLHAQRWSSIDGILVEERN